jgi:hypothetical protein
MNAPAGLLWLLAAAGATAQAPPAPAEPARPATVDEATWKRLLAFDAKAAAIVDLSAEFRQEKFTALLKKPMVSAGRVRLTASTVRWDTDKPRPSTLHIRGGELRLHYPEQSLLEIYDVRGRLRDLAASPILRLPALVGHFAPHLIAVRDLDAGAGEQTHLALRLEPRQDSLKEHLRHLRVLLEDRTGSVVKVEMTDADGERTVIGFTGARFKTGLAEAELELQVPAGTTVSRPLQGGRGGARGKGGPP